MSYRDIIRAWKDEEYRLTLSEEQRAVLPEHSAGLIELEDAELDNVQGGGKTNSIVWRMPGHHPLTAITNGDFVIT